MNRAARVFRIFGTVISYVRYGRTIVPLLAYAILKVCMILLYVSGGALTPNVLRPVLAPGAATEAIGHYPEHLLLMPVVLGRLDIALEILVLIIAQGATILLVAGVLREKRIGMRESLAGTGRRYAHLVLAAAIAAAALFAGFRYPVSVLERLVALPRGFGGGLSTLIGLVLQTLFLYAMPFILIEGRSAWNSIRRSFAFAGRHFIESFLLTLVPFLLTLPTLLLNLNPQAVAYQISPELLVHVQIAGEIMQLLAGYLLIGGLTIYFAETRVAEEDH